MPLTCETDMNRRALSRLALIVLSVGHLAISALGDVGPAAGADSSIGSAPLSSAPSSLGTNCRYGVAIHDMATLDQLPLVNPGWFLTFGAGQHDYPEGVEFVPLVWIEQDKDIDGNYLPSYSAGPVLTGPGLGARIQALPKGSTWIVGNEVDRGPDPGGGDPGQGDTYPDVYATAYHDVYHFIKERDPSAQVAISGLVEVTPGRLQYLDLVWASYLAQYGTIMPVDVWTMHLYVLPEVRPLPEPPYIEPNGIANVALGTDLNLGIRESSWWKTNPERQLECPDDQVYCYAEHDSLAVFEEQIRAMRIWMMEHSQRNKPLLLSEYSLIYPADIYDEYGQSFPQTRVVAYLQATVGLLESLTDPVLGYALDGDRLVQQWNWYSIYTDHEIGAVSNLIEYVDPDWTLTEPGQAYWDEIDNRSLEVNLLPDQVLAPPVSVVLPTDTATATLSVELRNNGNTAITSPITVTFFANEGLTQPIGSAVIEGLGGCARPSAWASVTWPDLEVGVHPFWVKLDSPEAIAETDESDNVATGAVLIGLPPSFLPLITR